MPATGNEAVKLSQLQTALAEAGGGGGTPYLIEVPRVGTASAGEYTFSSNGGVVFITGVIFESSMTCTIMVDAYSKGLTIWRADGGKLRLRGLYRDRGGLVYLGFVNASSVEQVNVTGNETSQVTIDASNAGFLGTSAMFVIEPTS